MPASLSPRTILSGFKDSKQARIVSSPFPNLQGGVHPAAQHTIPHPTKLKEFTTHTNLSMRTGTFKSLRNVHAFENRALTHTVVSEVLPGQNTVWVYPYPISLPE